MDVKEMVQSRIFFKKSWLRLNTFTDHLCRTQNRACGTDISSVLFTIQNNSPITEELTPNNLIHCILLI